MPEAVAMNPQTSIAHYRITTKLGEGGMGEVYRATDIKLGRDVALKVLPQNVAGDPDRLARFQREARAVAALNHPNIVTLYSVEESNGVHFITMELVEGKPLDGLISAGGLAVERIMEITSALAEALAAAHDKGIVHRDLKPANIMVTEDGRVKVLDFGLAKDVGAEAAGDATVTSAGHTQAGVVMGTPAYMSPEQIAGRPLDHRTDIFSLGVLLHEMATGQRPFQGTSSAELISSVLRDTPPLVTDARPELPADLARVTRRCLEKDPRHRMQTARDVANEFRDLARIASRPSLVSTSVSRGMAASDSGAARADEGFWVAVLPFCYKGTDQALLTLADGLTDEISTGLSRFSYLRVIARSSSSKYLSESSDVRTIGKELGARYVIEGNIRHAGSTVRLSIQLLDTTNGAHVWAESFEHAFRPDAIFAVQDQLVPRIVSTVADQHGVLPRSICAAIRKKSDDQLSPYEAIFRVFGLHENMNAPGHAACRDLLERVVRDAPDAADCWAMLATLYADEVWFGFNVRPDPLGREAAAAHRAIELAPASALASQAVAQSLFTRHEWQAFWPVAERTIALNPMDGATVAIMGIMLACSGEWERGCAVADSAMRLHPNFPGWYWLATLFNAYRLRDYRGAIAAALRIQMPGYFWTSLTGAAAYGQLGDHAAAGKFLQELLATRPTFPAGARRDLENWFDTELVEHFLDGLRKAGLEISLEKTVSASSKSSAPAAPVKTPSGETRTGEGFWVAVAPFKFTGTGAELAALAEGLTEEIVAGLSRFSYLRVLTKGTAGARYILEGNLRQAAAQLRVAVKLIDTTTGANLWAENFTRPFLPEKIFEIQDGLVPTIVSTIADMHGVLPRSMGQALRSRKPESLTPYEAVLRSFSYMELVTPEELTAARTGLLRAIENAPDYADAFAMLSHINCQDYGQGFDLAPDALADGTVAARRAVELAPTSHLAWFALAQALFFQREPESFRNAAQRAVALNPHDGDNLAFMGELLLYSGDSERGLELSARAKHLKPDHPGWYWYPDWFDAYQRRDYPAASSVLNKVQLPSHWAYHASVAATRAWLGERDPAARAITRLLEIRPTIAREVGPVMRRWWREEHVEHFLEGLRKAGLFDAERASQSQPTAATTDSGANRTQEGFWVAVLPFRASATDV